MTVLFTACSNLREQYLKTLQLLEANPHHPSLRLHALKGKLQGLHAVSINIGDHDAVYG